MKYPNGYGSITKLSGKRRKPWVVRAPGTIDITNVKVERHIIGTYETRKDAILALAEYNTNPRDLSKNKLTFSQIYDLWYQRKYVNGKRKYSESSVNCTKGAYQKCKSLHNKVFSDIRTDDMQSIIDDYTLSHAYMEHIKNLFRQLYAYALEYDIAQKDYSAYVSITKADDDEHGVPFTDNDIETLWNAYNNHVPNSDLVLMLIYSGWRISEFVGINEIDLGNGIMRGGVKTAAGKNRIVPIHSKILPLVQNKVNIGWYTNVANTTKQFKSAVVSAGITAYHTPHDCRHTFATLLNNAGANPVSVKRLLGHSGGNDVTEKIYTHKDISELRKAIELI
ncbi:MAG: site-specific integrase [Clostridium sp.]|nr:site-specific integrase [Clostridium sp.]MCM1459711.1 site-specific integrase [Bacteroides sp.]